MKNKLLPIIAAVVVAAAAVIVVIPKNKPVNTKETAKVSATEAAKTDATAATATETEADSNELNVEFSAEGGIEIAADDLPENEAAVINFNADGTDMAILAVKDSSGEIHTAFDTCQV
ncbi:MAG: hypothetical protein ACI4RF_03840, partial [Eubacterium sp.]